ncbi:amidohydrolase family protein [Aurantimonas sp. VKM B-3413]|uniref:amidohydrolase family protein n=1 Tax=Aurantimonas sp. VKM B-3413 TaxID=2779401 RepID=UPI001E49FB52|nr:amidohydrolase family protein [Aurantimonas sp. VKM B-3413]MCB8836938.1 amidohydrolase family protein [Aurantimonas sp. VKM B-3413]
MDLILRNARLAGDPAGLVDIGIEAGRIAVIEPDLSAEGETLDAAGRLVSPGFVETHLHLDKSCIMDRCRQARGDIKEAIAEVARVKAGFTAEDVYERGRRTIEKCMLQGTTHMRTQLEVDPGIGLRGFEGVRKLVEDFAFAIDIEICVFPQEGLLNNPGTDELMVEAMRSGAKVVGAAPYTDSDPHGQIERVFEIAREFDADIDMHLDFGADPSDLDLLKVCELAERYGRGGRVAIGHVTKLAYVPPERLEAIARRMRDAGVALTVLPSTDLFLMGREHDHGHSRGVTRAHEMVRHGVNCSLSTNNVLNPFTPFGDCSLIRMANLNANICHVGAASDLAECFSMVTTRAAKLMNLSDYGLEVGRSADLVVIDAESPQAAVAELSPVLCAFKRGRRTMTRVPAELHYPG